MTRQDMLDLLLRIEKHHMTTSLPLAIQNFGGVEEARAAGRQLWFKDVPAAITKLQLELTQPLPDTGAGLC